MTCESKNPDSISCEMEESHEYHRGMWKVNGEWTHVRWPNREYVGPVANAKETLQTIADRVESSQS